MNINHFCLGPVPIAVQQPEPHSVGGVLVHMPHVCSVCILKTKIILNLNKTKFIQKKSLFSTKKSTYEIYEND